LFGAVHQDDGGLAKAVTKTFVAIIQTWMMALVFCA
jgi:hypothetical protein